MANDDQPATRKDVEQLRNDVEQIRSEFHHDVEHRATPSQHDVSIAHTPGFNGNRVQTLLGILRPFSILFVIMARLARMVATDASCHVTKRGNARQFIFESGPRAPALLRPVSAR